mgnify:CR=1 FL=1
MNSMELVRFPTRGTRPPQGPTKKSPLPFCAHPSGYLIEYVAFASRNVRNTWLSGMSPAAANTTSGSSPPKIFCVRSSMRGSSGFGLAYSMADNREKRADWLKDLETVNSWTKSQPWCDPDRC